MFQGFTDTKLKLPIKNFCYDDYRCCYCYVIVPFIECVNRWHLVDTVIGEWR